MCEEHGEEVSLSDSDEEGEVKGLNLEDSDDKMPKNNIFFLFLFVFTYVL